MNQAIMITKRILQYLLLICLFYGYSQTDTTSIKSLEEIKLNTLRYTKSKNSNSQQFETITKKQIEFQNFQNTADLLSNSGTLSVQKSQQGGGSPVIRGFESSRVLLLVDGVRMNNLIFRGGHLQNVITVDENMLENADVLFGSSSTAYGSDALGGVINLQTKNAKLLSNKNTKKFSSNFNTRYSTVNKEKSAYLDFGFSGNEWATLTAFSYNDFDDLKMGSRKNGRNPLFGERPKYVETINGVDAIVNNSDPLVQKFSGYKQYNAMQKIIYSPNNTIMHSLNLQLSTTTDIPRYDRLTDIANNKLKTATWNYGPQKRILAAYKFNKEKAFLNSDLTIGANYQNVEESRITRDLGKPNETSRIEKVSVYGLNIDLKTKIGKADFLYGIDAFYDNLKSTADNKNITTGTITPASTRYPDGKNYTYRSEVFATYFRNISKKTSFNFGARTGFNNLHSDIVDNSILKLPYSSVDQKNITYSAATGIVTKATDHLKFAFNLSSGFRTPNIDDLAKIFESDASKNLLIVPNNNLKPEKTVTADISATLFNNDTFVVENTFFYTKLFDAIQTNAFQLNGQSQIVFNGNLSNVVANQNLGKANIIGFSTSLKSKITKNFNIYGTYNFTEGRLESETGLKPLDHIPPFYGKVGMNYENKWVNLDLFMLYNGTKYLVDYSTSGEDNLQYAPVDGMPSWETYSLKGAIKPIKELSLFTGIENILDTQYRTFSSGINSAGRNIYFGAKYTL
ncbi:TonB-dependent receptor plug domain-containing protein [Flavobacterium sp.]|uniref:TonB-dependent receptor plug domain-containing protein n=1 Tax=Flavobacterium sp. TaxID=239 RepID=UPI00286D829B|nr:TonB-dependent receptor plug domain-containing protein [Flavobacterium sp.]